MTGQKPDSGHNPDTLTIPAAAARLGVNERTLRRWVASGKVESLAEGPRRLIPVSALADLVTESSTPDPDTLADTVRTAAPEADTVRPAEADLLALRQELATAEQRADQAKKRIAGAHQAARMLAVRLSEARADLERERQRAEGLAEELAALRQELRDERDRAAEREQQHATAERELRVLLLRASESLAQALTTHQALTSSRRRAWWRVWDR